MVDEDNRTPRELFKQKISEALYGIRIRPSKEHLEVVVETGMPMRLSGNERDEGVQLVLDAIKEAGGVVLMPSNDLRIVMPEGKGRCVDVWRPSYIPASDRGDGYMTVSPAQYVNVLDEQL